MLLVRNKEANDMIIRPQYMNTLKTYRDVPLVKILAGIRRCGKSTILDMLRDDLLKCGIAADHILSMRYTSEDFDDGMTDKAMYQGIKEQMTDDGRYDTGVTAEYGDQLITLSTCEYSRTNGRMVVVAKLLEE